MLVSLAAVLGLGCNGDYGHAYIIHVNSQLVCLLLDGIFNLYFLDDYLFPVIFE